MLAVCRYYLGRPFHHIAGSQARLGVPLPEATQGALIETGGDSGHGVFRHRAHLAAQGEVSLQDAPAVRILSLVQEHQEFAARADALGLSRSPERTGMDTTALVGQVGEQSIGLYYSGRSQAGEHLASLLQQRPAGGDKPLVLLEARSRNEAAQAQLIRCHCLAHGRRKCRELAAVLPHECPVVIEALQQVLDHAEVARQEPMAGPARRADHQDYSGRSWLRAKPGAPKQLDDRLVEPNSSLGTAMAYMQGHWETRTRFLPRPGPPVDNNRCERALHLCMRQRKNARCYKTEHRASVASVLSSLRAPGVQAGVTAVDDLGALPEHRPEVFVPPAAWLPGNYARGAP